MRHRFNTDDFSAIDAVDTSIGLAARLHELLTDDMTKPSDKPHPTGRLLIESHEWSDRVTEILQQSEKKNSPFLEFVSTEWESKYHIDIRSRPMMYPWIAWFMMSPQFASTDALKSAVVFDLWTLAHNLYTMQTQLEIVSLASKSSDNIETVIQQEYSNLLKPAQKKAFEWVSSLIYLATLETLRDTYAAVSKQYKQLLGGSSTISDTTAFMFNVSNKLENRACLTLDIASPNDQSVVQWFPPKFYACFAVANIHHLLRFKSEFLDGDFQKPMICPEFSIPSFSAIASHNSIHYSWEKKNGGLTTANIQLVKEILQRTRNQLLEHADNGDGQIDYMYSTESIAEMQRTTTEDLVSTPLRDREAAFDEFISQWSSGIRTVINASTINHPVIANYIESGTDAKKPTEVVVSELLSVMNECSGIKLTKLSKNGSNSMLLDDMMRQQTAENAAVTCAAAIYQAICFAKCGFLNKSQVDMLDDMKLFHKPRSGAIDLDRDKLVTMLENAMDEATEEITKAAKQYMNSRRSEALGAAESIYNDRIDTVQPRVNVINRLIKNLFDGYMTQHQKHMKCVQTMQNSTEMLSSSILYSVIIAPNRFNPDLIHAFSMDVVSSTGKRVDIRKVMAKQLPKTGWILEQELLSADPLLEMIFASDQDANVRKSAFASVLSDKPKCPLTEAQVKVVWQLLLSGQKPVTRPTADVLGLPPAVGMNLLNYIRFVLVMFKAVLSDQSYQPSTKASRGTH